MRKRLLICLILMVLLPLGVLTWLGVRLARSEIQAVKQRFRELAEERLYDFNSSIMQVLAASKREVDSINGIYGGYPDYFRRLLRNNGRITQYFVMDPEGKLLFPDPKAKNLTSGEREFLQRTAKLREEKVLLNGHAEPENNVPVKQPGNRVFSKFIKQKITVQQEVAADSKSGWHPWFWENGINLIYWRELPNGNILGAELDRVRLTSDIIGKLPDTSPVRASMPNALIRMRDSRDRIVYQWGGFSPAEKAKPQASLPLSFPLSSWRLEYYSGAPEFSSSFGGSIYFTLIVVLGCAGSVLLLLGIYFYRESLRDIREASTRVSFVNRVSHELKTPLTNIRLYAELLENNLAENDTKLQGYLKIITSESQRLSRLINNVLSFSRSRRGRLKITRIPGNIDGAVREIIAKFEPDFTAKGIEIKFTPGADGSVRFDPDALEQILINLFSNAGKYAADGKLLEVNTDRDGNMVMISVSDRGPGIPASERDRVFQPFQRLGNKLNEGVSGTGIGLNIARELARLHGGGLTLEPAKNGAKFLVILKVT